jgi:hypothetical protein
MIWWGKRSSHRVGDREAALPPIDENPRHEFAPFDEIIQLGIDPMPISPPCFIASRAESLEQLLEAFRDIADRDDIHQAADRLLLVLEWIRRDAACAAADPIFAPIRLAS